MKTDTKAKELMAIVSKTVVGLFNTLGEVRPILHMVDEFNNHIPVHWAGGFENYRAKDMTADVMRNTLKAANAQRYALVIEAWGTHERDGAHAMAWKQRTGKSLEEYPDRIEMITIFVEDKNTKEHLYRTYRILRPEYGKPTLSPPKDVDRTGDQIRSSGRFNNLFEEERE